MTSLSGFNPELADRQLNELSNSIADTDIAIQKQRNELTERTRQLGVLRTEIEAEVYQETDSSGKAKYSNPEQRKSAVARYQQATPGYRALLQKSDELENAIAVLTVTREDLSRKRQNILAILAFETSRNYAATPATIHHVHQHER